MAASSIPTIPARRRLPWKMKLTQLWVCLLLAATATDCAHFQRRDAIVPLRVLTYNIRAGNGELQRTAETIRRLAPDIAGLQEVDVNWSERSGFEDQARSLGESLGMQVRFAPIYMLAGTDPAKPARQYGVAVLSKYRIVRWRNDTLTRLSTIVRDPKPAPAPGLLEATIDVDGVAVRVFNTHLDYRSDPRMRKQQVEEMLAHMGDAPGPTLVLGDLNATPEAPELQPLLQRLRDTWQSNADPGFTFPADKPSKRIDYVLTSNHFRVRSASVPVTEASDHRPVLVELLLHR
jgi:endonuclease/exonuclease/phosphatase family metal-dependent hydrolase